MSERYPIPAADFHREEESIKRSRFIVTMGHAPTMEDARAFVAMVKEEFPDATHNCWAFQAGPPGDTGKVGMSDDGEPSGTAGRPMLNILLHSGVGEVAAVVTRYFGGTKLGTGGLVRAYSGLVQAGLATLPTRERIVTAHLAIQIPYASITLFKRMLTEHEVEIREEDFGVDAGFTVELPQEREKGFVDALRELTNGKAIAHRTD